MTTGEYLDSISTLTNVSALTHLQNIETGGGGDVFINSDIITLKEEDPIRIEEVDNVIIIKEVDDIIIQVDDNVDEISEEKGDIIDGIC